MQLLEDAFDKISSAIYSNRNIIRKAHIHDVL